MTGRVSEIAKDSGAVLSLNCENADERLDIENKTTTELRNLFSGYDFVFIDEAQRVANIGLTIKRIADLKLKTQFIVTGSYSLELAEGIYEPATSSHIDYELFPFSVTELVADT